MPAPTYTWNTINATQTDADSPGDAVLMEAIRQNLITLKEVLYDTYTPAKAHNHDGTNSAVIGPAIAQGNLKSTNGSVYTQTAAELTLPGGAYGFYPQTKSEAAATVGASIRNSLTGTTFVTNIYLFGGGGASNGVFAQQQYIQASPPYKIGSRAWGHFVYLLRDIATGMIKAAYEAEDPCWAYNGAVYLPKDDPGRMAVVPHPFANYWQKDPAVDGLEIVLVDTTGQNTKKWAADSRFTGQSPLENLSQIISGKGKSQVAAGNAGLSLPAITGFTDRVSIVTP